ncbi:hypothetical protein FVE85_0275 [Porphyridium purpureum]|uniref:Uncharacterized protein n=1 Tax=Porphyridium purpureum TaxID=35688 RepID=A0A5J4YZ06_PORPP|nr:hypothetical protein FVE85_0275 [Porphyridium purpureum]|eukprot:POR8608..scf208_2
MSSRTVWIAVIVSVILLLALAIVFEFSPTGALSEIRASACRSMSTHTLPNANDTPIETLRPSAPTPSVPKRKFAYALLSYGNDYRNQICPAYVAAQAIRQADPDPDRPIIILRIAPLPQGIDPPLGDERVSIRYVKPAKSKGRYGWVETYSKFRIVEFEEFDAVALLDFDVMLRRPLTPLFELSQVTGNTIVAPRAYFIDQPYWMSGGPLVITPTSDLQSAFRGVLEEGGYFGPGEMDWFNKDPNVTDQVEAVSGFWTLLVGEFFPGDKIYKYWGSKLGLSPSMVYERAFLFHFIATWKPWSNGIGEAKGRVTPELRRAYREWNELRKVACPQMSDHVPGYRVE